MILLVIFLIYIKFNKHLFFINIVVQVSALSFSLHITLSLVLILL